MRSSERGMTAEPWDCPLLTPNTAIRIPHFENEKTPRKLSLSRGSLVAITNRRRLVVVHRAAILEVEHPPPVVPFERHFPPAQRHLRIRVERANVRPGRGRILLGVG